MAMVTVVEPPGPGASAIVPWETIPMSRNSILYSKSSVGWTAEIVILPSPWLLLFHSLHAPTSVVAGEYSIFIAGSLANHTPHSRHAFRSATSGNIADGFALTMIERSTR